MMFLFEDVAGVAAQLVRGRQVVGRHACAGPRARGKWRWSVTTSGSTILAHDAFEAARWFCRLEAGGASPKKPVRLNADAAISARADEVRWAAESTGYRSVVIDMRRDHAAREAFVQVLRTRAAKP